MITVLAIIVMSIAIASPFENMASNGFSPRLSIILSMHKKRYKTAKRAVHNNYENDLRKKIEHTLLVPEHPLVSFD